MQDVNLCSVVYFPSSRLIILRLPLQYTVLKEGHWEPLQRVILATNRYLFLVLLIFLSMDFFYSLYDMRLFNCFLFLHSHFLFVIVACFSSFSHWQNGLKAIALGVLLQLMYCDCCHAVARVRHGGLFSTQVLQHCLHCIPGVSCKPSRVPHRTGALSLSLKDKMHQISSAT